MKKPRRRCHVHGVRLLYKPTVNGTRYICPVIGCTVLCWGKPTSRPADFETRQLRRECHLLFDAIWQAPDWGNQFNTKSHETDKRNNLYRWLGRRMGIAHRNTHFGMFNSAKCLEALSILTEYRMIMFNDGPAKGKLIAVTRAPFLLRIAVDPLTKECTALDDLKMRPIPGDKCYAYIMINKLPDEMEKGQKRPVATYQLFEYQPDQPTFAIKEKWSKWCMDMANGPALPIAEKAKIVITVDVKTIDS